jgi:hypothetical protein
MVRVRDLQAVIRQSMQVGWQGDPRAERRKQARALAKKWWMGELLAQSIANAQSANAEKPQLISTPEESA